MSARDVVKRFVDAMRSRLDAEGRASDGVGLYNRVVREITRADGTIERAVLHNQTIAGGLNKLAQLAIADGSSGFRFLSVGTVTQAASLGSNNWGEVSRKAGATVATSAEVLIVVATWAGNTDALTGVALASSALVNHANSGQGEILSIINSVDATLGASDFLKLQHEIQIGSHAL